MISLPTLQSNSKTNKRKLKLRQGKKRRIKKKEIKKFHIVSKITVVSAYSVRFKSNTNEASWEALSVHIRPGFSQVHAQRSLTGPQRLDCSQGNGAL